MRLHHYPLISLYMLRRFRQKALKVFDKPQKQLRVLLYHDVAPKEMAYFELQIRWLSKRWNFLSPKEFEAICNGEKELARNSLLLTFDDGFKSNKVVAEHVLKPMGIKALFFIVPNFAAINSDAEARDFVLSNIYPGMSKSTLPAHWLNMTWQDIRDLLNQGHSIGSHTLSHARLSKIDDNVALQHEIDQSILLLEQNLDIQVEHFAYTFGDITCFSKSALAIAASRFKFVYSGLRGDNQPNCVSNVALRRDAILASDPLCLVGSFLEGCADFYYKKSLATLDHWAKDIC